MKAIKILACISAIGTISGIALLFRVYHIMRAKKYITPEINKEYKKYL